MEHVGIVRTRTETAVNHTWTKGGEKPQHLDEVWKKFEYLLLFSMQGLHILIYH